MNKRALTDLALVYEVTNRLNGFLKIPKSMSQVLWHELGISANALQLYQHLVASAGFDSRNRNYTKTPYTTSDLIKFFKKFDSRSIRNWIEELRKHSLIKIEPNEIISINHYGLIFEKGIFLKNEEAKSTTSISVYLDKWTVFLKQATEKS